VHPLQAAYVTIASALDHDISDEGARYINPPKSSTAPPEKRTKIDQSKLRQDWVVGCSAALPRRDTVSGQINIGGNSSRGRSRGGPARPKMSWPSGSTSGRGRGGGGGGEESRMLKKSCQISSHSHNSIIIVPLNIRVQDTYR
jgi:hypothetical protein